MLFEYLFLRLRRLYLQEAIQVARLERTLQDLECPKLLRLPPSRLKVL